MPFDNFFFLAINVSNKYNHFTLCPFSFVSDDLLVDIQENLTDLSSKENFLKLSIRALYEEIQGEEVYAMLTIDDKEVVQMLQPFMVLMHSHFTFITQHIWKYHVPKDTELSLSQLADQVWRPCFEEIQHLIEKLHAKSVTLKEIDDYFQNIPSQNLEHEICRLVEGFNLCLHKAASVTWVSQVVVSINHYRNIIEVQEVAELLLAAKNSLEVHTEFEELKRLKKRVSTLYTYKK